MAFLQLDSTGTVRGVSANAQDMAQPVYAGLTQIEIDDFDPRIAAFLAAQAPKPPRPTPLQWLRRLTLDKQQAIFAAAATNPVVLGWLFEADGVSTGIDVTDPSVAQGVIAIAAAVPVFTAADQSTLLAP